jgi:hypothetical protein
VGVLREQGSGHACFAMQLPAVDTPSQHILAKPSTHCPSAWLPSSPYTVAHLCCARPATQYCSPPVLRASRYTVL